MAWRFVLIFIHIILNWIPGGLDEPDAVNKLHTQDFSANLDFENG